MRLQRPLKMLAVSSLVVALTATPILAAEAGVSYKLGLSTYADREGPVTLVVDSYTASLRDSDDYVPIRIALGIVGKGKTVVFDTESFTLTDRNGHEVPLASYRDVQANYDKRLADESVMRTRAMMLDSRFDALDRVDSRFFPSPSSRSTRVARVELSPGTWMQDVLYFPRPEDGTRGIMTLTVRGRGMDYPIKIKFRVHETGKNDRLGG